MPSCRAICEGALRKIGVLAAGRAARSTDVNDALSSLQSLYMGWIDSGAFGRLRDVIPLADYVACENERVFRQNDGCTQVTLPETVPACMPWAFGYWDYETDPWGPIVSNNTNWQQRPPRDCAVVIINDAFTATTTSFIYDGAIKVWTGLDGLTLDSNAPLGTRNPDGLSSCLAVQMVDEFGGDAPPTTVRSAANFQSALLTRFSAPRVEAHGVYL